MGSVRAVLYARVSTEEQAKGYSLQTQLERCGEYAAQQGYLVIEEIEDTQSGEQLERVALSRLFDFVEKTPVNVVIVYDPDRMSRGGPAHHAIIEMRLEKYGVKLEYVIGDYNQDSPESALSKMIKQSIAWYENQQRRERSNRGKIGKAKSGKVLVFARPPYGYNSSDGLLSINEDEAAIVRSMFEWLLDGESSYTIAKKLCERRIPTRADKDSSIVKSSGYGIWHPSAVKKILKNETYMGVWHYNKRKRHKLNGKIKLVDRPKSEWIAVAVPPIIEQTVFERAQRQLAANQAQSKRNTKRAYLLQGMLYCTCGLVCACSYRRNLRYYRCPIKGGQTWRRKCETRFHGKAETLEMLVWDAVAGLLLNEENLREGIAHQRTLTQSDVDHLYEQLTAIAAAKVDTERKIGILLEQLLEAEFPKSIIDERKRLLLDKLRVLENEESKLQVELSTSTITPEMEDSLLQFAATICRSIQDIGFEEKRKVFQLLMVRVNVLDKHHVRISGLLPFPKDVLEIGSFMSTSLGHCGRRHKPPLRLF